MTSMFTRNDNKPADASASASPTAIPAPAPQPEVKRPQATAQTLSPAPSGGVSVISKALKITGQLESTEDIRIDGEIDGDVKAASVTVGPNARVKGTVYGDTVELSGAVEGKIEAKKVVLTGTAKMTGDVIHQDIRIESGAFIDGHCRPLGAKSAEVKSLNPKPAIAS
jgi:cytoskeletal protein CcmA (bactofilin family)